PVTLSEQQPVHRAAGCAILLQITERARGITVLPAIESRFLAPLEQFEDAFRRVPIGLVFAQEPVEVRVAIDRVAPDDQARDRVRPELDGGQERVRGEFRGGGRRGGGGADSRGQSGGLMEEVAARGGVGHGGSPDWNRTVASVPRRNRLFHNRPPSRVGPPP